VPLKSYALTGHYNNHDIVMPNVTSLYPESGNNTSSSLGDEKTLLSILGGDL